MSLKVIALVHELLIIPRICQETIVKHISLVSFVVDGFHYDNTPIQYTAIVKAVKHDNFLLKSFDIFLIFAQNIECGYTLDKAVLTCTHNLYFRAKIRK